MSRRAMMLVDGAELVLRFTGPVDEVRFDAETARRFAALLVGFADQLDLRTAELDAVAMASNKELAS